MRGQMFTRLGDKRLRPSMDLSSRSANSARFGVIQKPDGPVLFWLWLTSMANPSLMS
jgi:hypothetical protein